MSTDRNTWAPEQGFAAAGGGTTERYALLERLGAGGMGEVWRAMDRELGRTVAVKVLRPELATKQVARFLNEARATAQLEHRGIVPVHDAGRLPDGRLFYVMQEIRGETFASAIAAVHAASGEGPWRAAPDGRTFLALVAVFEDVCDTLAYAHARGVLHRDLKPENVMLGEFGEVHVVDWGLVKRIGTSDPGEQEATDVPQLAPGGTLVGQVAGTLGYMSPEQLAGRVDDLGRASDVYSLGAILYHVLFGGPPPAWAQPEFEDPRAPAELVAICRRALDPQPARRYRDAGALAAAVRRWREEETARSVRDARIAAAERAFLDLDGPLRERVREVLLWLVDADAHAIPRRTGDLDDPAREAAVRAGLVVERGGALHLAEEALLDWERLRGWVEVDRAGQRLRHALGGAAGAWEAGGRRGADLWRGERLGLARAWRRSTSPWLPASEREFLDTSERVERRRRRLGITTALGVGLGLAVAAAVATWAWQRAERSLDREQIARQEAVSRGLAAEVARRELAGQPHSAMVFEAARGALAGETTPRVDWLAARYGGLTLGPAPDREKAVGGEDEGPAAFTTEAGRIIRLAPETGEALWSTESGLADIMWVDGALSPTVVLASDHAGRIVTLDASTGARLARYDGLDSISMANAVDPTGQFVATSVFAGSVDLWETRAGVRVGRIALEDVGPAYLAFAPDGLSLVVQTPQWLARWSPPALRRTDRHGCAASGATPSRDGARLLLQGRGALCVVDLVGDTPRVDLPAEPWAWANAGELWSPRQLTDATYGLLGAPITGWHELDPPLGGWLLRDAAGPLRLTPSGEHVRLPAGTPVAIGGPWLLAQAERETQVVDLRTGAIHARLPDEARAQLLAEVAVWGDRVVAGQPDGRLFVWDLPATPSPELPPRPPDVTLAVSTAPVSLVVPAGDRLLVGHGDGAFEVLDPDLGTVAAGKGWGDVVSSLALSPDRQRLLVGVGHASFGVWHLATGRAIVGITRERRGALHSVGWTARGDVWGAGIDGAWTWTVPAEPASPLALTNLRVCDGTLTAIPVTDPPADTPWVTTGCP